MKKLLGMAVVAAGILVSSANAQYFSYNVSKLSSSDKTCFSYVYDESTKTCQSTLKFYNANSLQNAIDKVLTKNPDYTKVIKSTTQDNECVFLSLVSNKNTNKGILFFKKKIFCDYVIKNNNN